MSALDELGRSLTDHRMLPMRTSIAGNRSEKHAGPVVSAIVRTEAGPVFARGLHRDHPRRWTQEMEAVINPYVCRLSPRLLWRVQGEWDVLGFELVDGRHADYRPGAADLPKVADTITALGTIQCPDVPVKLAEDRWRTYVDTPEELEWFKSDRLLHTDYNPLIADGRALLIDWAWQTRGAGWIDPACCILCLMANGHSAESAERVVAEVPTWQAAPAEGVSVFARACVRMWSEIADNDPASWILAMAEAAKAWAIRWIASSGR